MRVPTISEHRRDKAGGRRQTAEIYEVSTSSEWSLRRLIASINSRHVLLVVGGENISSLDVSRNMRRLAVAQFLRSNFFLACHISLALTKIWYYM